MKTIQIHSVNKENLSSRIKIARTLVPFAIITQRNRQGQITGIEVPGRDGKRYSVYLKRTNIGFECQCYLNTGAGEIDCKGSGSSVCYHQIVAIILAAKDAGMEVSVAHTKESAKKINHIKKGKLVGLVSKQSFRDKGTFVRGIWLIISKD